MKKSLYIVIAVLFCVMFVVSCGSREKKNIVGASGGTGNMLSTDSAAKVLTTDALNALKAVSKTTSAKSTNSYAPGLTGTQRLASPALAQWYLPNKDADGYYIVKSTDSEDGTIYDVRIKPTPDYWPNLVTGGEHITLDWDSLSDETDYTITMDVKGTFDGPTSSGTFTDPSSRFVKIRRYSYTWGYGFPDLANFTETHVGESTITKKSDKSWIKTKNTGTNTFADPNMATLNTNATSPFSSSQTNTMTFQLSSGYTGEFNMKIEINGSRGRYYEPYTYTSKGQLDGKIYLSGNEIVRLHVEGESNEKGEKKSMVGYYTSKDDNFTARTSLTTEQLTNMMTTVFGMTGGLIF